MSRISGLFRRSTELPTALSLKAQNWTPSNYAELLEEIRAKSGKYTLHEDTVTALSGPLSTVTDPLIRYSCSNSLSKLNSKFRRRSLGESFLRGFNVEQAVNCFCAEDFDKTDLTRRLINLGGDMIVHNLAKELPAALQMLLFQRALTDDNYKFAVNLWKNRNNTGLTLSKSQQDQFLQLAGAHQDLAIFSDIAETYFDEVTPLSARAALNCAIPYGIERTLDALVEMKTYLRLVDTVHAADVLAPNALQLLKDNLHENFIYEVLLLGLYRQNKSLTVLHTFHYLVSTEKMRLSHDALQIAANAAYRLGNSKLLSARIWRDAVKVGLSRKLCETLLACQFVGTGYRSSFFFLAEMRRHGIYLRSHIQRTILSKFERLADASFAEVFADFSKLDNIREFDDDLAMNESRPLSNQAKANALVYEQGKNPDEDPLKVLASMLEFDKA